VKSVDPREFEDVQVAARMIYLNKASCNGMYRVNKDGQFNSAWGKKRSVHVSTDNIHAASRALLNTNVMQGDFGCVLDYARTGDFCYIDPPYPNSFQAYTAIGFDDSDQSRLHSVCVELDKRNVMFMQSNSDCPLIRRLYSDFHHIVPVQARRSISCDGDGRGTANELLITNY
jgi:DNA adenine methylase